MSNLDADRLADLHLPLIGHDSATIGQGSATIGHASARNGQNSPAAERVVKIGVVAAVIDGAGRVLCIRRSAKVPAPLKICLPGGTVERGESLEAAVVREMREEVGLAIEPTGRFWDWTHPSGNLRLTGFLATHVGGELSPLEAEVAEVMWLSLDDAAAHPDSMPSMVECMATLQRHLSGGR